MMTQKGNPYIKIFSILSEVRLAFKAYHS